MLHRCHAYRGASKMGDGVARGLVGGIAEENIGLGVVVAAIGRVTVIWRCHCVYVWAMYAPRVWENDLAGSNFFEG